MLIPFSFYKNYLGFGVVSILFIWYLHFLWIRDFTSRTMTIKEKTFFKNKFELFLYQRESSAAKNLNIKLPTTINLSLYNSKYLKYFHFPHFFFSYHHYIYLRQWNSLSKVASILTKIIPALLYMLRDESSKILCSGFS